MRLHHLPRPVSARRLFLLHLAFQLFILPPSWSPHVSHEGSYLSPSPPSSLCWISFSFLLHHALRMTFVSLHILLLNELISWLVAPEVSHSCLFCRHRFIPEQYFSQLCTFLMFISQFKTCRWHGRCKWGVYAACGLDLLPHLPQINTCPHLTQRPVWMLFRSEGVRG